MANPEHLAILRKGVEQWNDWVERGTENLDTDAAWVIAAELRGADLTRMRLAGVNLMYADLSGASLAGPILTVRF